MDAAGFTDEALRTEVRTWSARMARGDAVLLDLISELDARGAWFVDGVLSCAHWLSWQLGWSASTSRERVRVGRALRDLPLIREALHEGVLTYSQVRAVTRIASAGDEDAWLQLARVSTGEQLDKVARGAARARAANRPKEERPVKRAAQVDWDEDGDLVLTLRVPAHQALPVLEVLNGYQAAEQNERDEQLAEFLATALGSSSDSAEALDQLPLLDVAVDGVLAVVPEPAAGDSAEAAEQPAEPVGGDSAEAAEVQSWFAREAAKGHDPLRPYPYIEPPCPIDFNNRLTVYMTAEERAAEDAWRAECRAARDLARAWDARRDRLLAEASAARVPTGRATLADGFVRALTRPLDGPKTTVRLLLDPLSGWARTQHDELLPPATVDEIVRAFPTTRAAMSSGFDPTRWDQGRDSRTVSPGLRRLLGQLDGERCRFPGCTHTRFLHAHHVVFWRDGGRTDLGNLVLLCTRHHRLLHAEGYLLSLDPDTRALTVASPDGIPLEAHPKLPSASAESLPIAQPREPGYGGEPLDLSFAVAVMLEHAA